MIALDHHPLPESGDRRVLFLDRDGVVIENRRSYVLSVDDVVFLPGVIETLASMTASGVAMMFVTNQSPPGRGLCSLEQLMAVHSHVVKALGQGGATINASFICPHAPTDDCLCRKPKPGMLLAAGQRYGVSLQDSVMIGDSDCDIAAASAAGIRAFRIAPAEVGQHGQTFAGLPAARSSIATALLGQQ